jgi:hypothetical protein
MQDHLKFLVVEDHPAWSEGISAAVRDYFQDRRGFCKARVRDFSAMTARQADQLIAEGGWDLVMLDMNLGEGAGAGKISGLDLLGEIAAGNKAYFVIIVTGAVNDPTLEKVYGPETAAMLRFGAMNEAVRKMPASRVRILHKPVTEDPAAALEILRPQLESALEQYCSVSLERNVFRPLPGDPGLWEMCFNGGPRLTLKHAEPFQLIRSALSQPNRALKVIQLVQALAHRSGKAGAVIPEDHAPKAHRRSSTDLEYMGHQEDLVDGLDGVDWSEMDGFSLLDHAPVDTDDGSVPIESLIGGLLLARSRNLDLDTMLESFEESFGIEVLLSLPAKAAAWAKDGARACREFNSDDAPAELMELSRALRDALATRREVWLRDRQNSPAAGSKEGKKPKSGKIRVSRGTDTPELVLARQHWQRFKKILGARPALAEFREHMIQWIDRSPTAKGHLHYRPPGGDDLCPFWWTE